MTGRGRPLRFLVAVVAGWVGVRAAMLWPTGVVPELARAIVPPAAAARAQEGARTTERITPSPATYRRPVPPPVVTAAVAMRRPAVPRTPAVTDRHLPLLVQTSGPANGPITAPLLPAPAFVPPPGIGLAPVFRTSRWSGSAWAIARPGGRATPFASQLGGSQTGARIAFALDDARRVAVYARGSAAIDSRQQEGAIGLDWRPTRAPVHLIVERRIGIAGIDGGTAAGVIGGIGPAPIGAGLRVEGYGQGGVIVRDKAEGFVDGSARITRTLGPIDLGLGAWGAAQRGAARLDLGPTIGVGVPVAGRSVRLTADWRQRVAGNARPGSGPAVSIGLNF